jgi:PTS system nitrogen regulatory IIA component
MDISEFLRPEAVVGRQQATHKKQAQKEAAARAAGVAGLDVRAVFDVLLERERLGSTGVGHGVAIPHGKIRGLEGIHGTFARLGRPIDFESIDGQPVDLMFVLLAPEQAGADHLKALARVSRLLRDPATCEKLRRAADEHALYDLLAGGNATKAA